MRRDLTLAALEQHGAAVVDTLVSAASVAARAGTPAQAAGANTRFPSNRRPYSNRPDALSQSTLFDQLLSTLAEIAREQPLLLLLDNLHWVDDASAAFVVHLGRELRGNRSAACRLLVLGAYRSATVALCRRDAPSGQAIRHPLASAINELQRIMGDL